MVIHAQIHESDIVNVHLGDKAEVTMESVPNHTFEATVNRFSLTPLAPVWETLLLRHRIYDTNSDYVLRKASRARSYFSPGWQPDRVQ